MSQRKEEPQSAEI